MLEADGLVLGGVIMAKQRDILFDFVKGVLIFLVVWGHVIRGRESIVYHVIYSFHMPLFVFVSGYFAVHTLRKSVMDVGKKVLNRLIVPALIWSGVALLIHLLRGYERGLGSMVMDSLRDVWFLYCVALLYVLGSVVFKAERWRYVVAVLLAALGYAVYKLPGVVYIEYFQPIRLWPLFVMGFAYYEYKQKFESRPLLWAVIIVSVAVYASLMLWLASNHPIEYVRSHENYLLRAVIYQTGAVAWFAVFSALYRGVEKVSKGGGFITSLGCCTMGVYVIHEMIILLLPSNMLGDIPYCIVAAILTALSYVATLLVKKSSAAAKYLLGE